MILNILLLIWGVTELIIGGVVAIKKELPVLKSIVESFSFINGEFSLEKITDIKGFSRWIGEIVLVEGALYIFLSSAAIFFKMNIFIVIIFICVIEVLFFNIIMKGIQTILNK